MIFQTFLFLHISIHDALKLLHFEQRLIVDEIKRQSVLLQVEIHEHCQFRAIFEFLAFAELAVFFAFVLKEGLIALCIVRVIHIDSVSLEWQLGIIWIGGQADNVPTAVESQFDAPLEVKIAERVDGLSPKHGDPLIVFGVFDHLGVCGEDGAIVMNAEMLTGIEIQETDHADELRHVVEWIVAVRCYEVTSIFANIAVDDVFSFVVHSGHKLFVKQ
mmetsp:Transcript_36124/g.58024  ORF Transcript_36124/g.58024 Transcript_36124/m.58024 type:complete len:217 (+) Transcript_36124:414-1064(+)